MKATKKTIRRITTPLSQDNETTLTHAQVLKLVASHQATREACAGLTRIPVHLG